VAEDGNAGPEQDDHADHREHGAEHDQRPAERLQAIHRQSPRASSHSAGMSGSERRGAGMS